MSNIILHHASLCLICPSHCLGFCRTTSQNQARNNTVVNQNNKETDRVGAEPTTLLRRFNFSHTTMNCWLSFKDFFGKTYNFSIFLDAHLFPRLVPVKFKQVLTPHAKYRIIAPKTAVKVKLSCSIWKCQS